MSQAWSGVHYKGYAFTDQELASVIETLGKSVLDVKKEYWADKLANVREYISKALDAVFSDADTWRRIMEGRAVPRYSQFVNPQYARASNILLKYRVKLAGAFQKWKTNKDRAFAEGGAFEQGVMGAKDFYIEGVKIVYRMTGVRPLGLGPAVKAFLVVAGIKPPIIEGKDTLEGEPVNLIFSDTLYFVGYAVIPSVVEATVYANYAHMAGDAETRDQILRDISATVQEFLARLAKDTVSIDEFKVAYDENVENYFVELRASPKSTP